MTSTNSFQFGPTKTLAGEYLPDLLALAARFYVDMFSFDGEQPVIVVQIGLGAAVVAGPHREPVGDQVGEAQDQHDAPRHGGPRHPGDDREGRYGAVDSTVDKVSQIVAVGIVGEAFPNRLPCVGMFQPLG